MTDAVSLRSNRRDAVLLLCHFLPDCVFTAIRWAAMLSEVSQKEHMLLASLSVISSRNFTHWHFWPAPAPLCFPQIPIRPTAILTDLVLAIPCTLHGMTLWLVCLYLHLFVCILQYEKLSTQFVKYWTNSEDVVTHPFVKAFLHWNPPIPHFFWGLKWLRHEADHSPLG